MSATRILVVGTPAEDLQQALDAAVRAGKIELVAADYAARMTVLPEGGVVIDELATMTAEAFNAIGPAPAQARESFIGYKREHRRLSDEERSWRALADRENRLRHEQRARQLMRGSR